MPPSLQYILLTTIVLALASCNRSFIGLTTVDCKTINKDAANNGLHVRIANTGKIGISSVQINTGAGIVTLCGANPGDTTGYYKIAPFCSKIEPMVTSVQFSRLKKPKALSALTPHSPNERCEKVFNGKYLLIVSWEKKKGDYTIERMFIKED